MGRDTVHRLHSLTASTCQRTYMWLGIGGGAQSALAEAGIQLLGGVSGNADEAVRNYISGNLVYNPDVHCTHHDHEHTCGAHHCGEDKHGCVGNGKRVLGEWIKGVFQ